MPVTTDQIDMAPSVWTVLAEDVSSFFGQLATDGPAMIYVGAEEPEDDPAFGVRLYRGAAETFQIEGLTPGTDIVYGRPKNNETETMVVVLTAPEVAP